jgi:cytochrome c biogenesis protein CcmG/thiol:disulfide interchange protein DsbE
VRRLALLLVVVPVLAGCGGCGSNNPESAAPPRKELERALAGSPPALADLHRQANELVGGGRKAFEARLLKLRGHPVVVNKWASWCAPCRAEFPLLQRASVRYGKRIAFLGVNSEDNDGNARKFLARFPVSYPSYVDGDGRAAAAVNAGVAFPTTVFIDAAGKVVYSHPGQYRTEADLAADIRRYTR